MCRLSLFGREVLAADLAVVVARLAGVAHVRLVLQERFPAGEERVARLAEVLVLTCGVLLRRHDAVRFGRERLKNR